MRTPRYLPGVRNGAVAKRQARSKNPATAKAFGVGTCNSRPRHPRPNSNSAGEGRGARVLWTMILIGMALATGFVFALRSQINAYRIAQAEEQLKMKLDQYASQQPFLTLDQQRALSADEIERAGKRNGLDHLKLDREEDRRNASAQRVASQNPPVKARQSSDQRDRRAVNASRPIKRTGSHAKVVRGVKTGRGAKVIKVVKLNAAKSSGAANKARPNAVKTRKQNQRQTSRARR